MTPPTLSKPYWYQLLDYWVNTGDNSGLSLPFLVGAQTVIREDFLPGADSIRALLGAIVNGEGFDHCVTLSYCGTIQAYILGLQDREEVSESCFFSAAGTPTLAVLGRAFAAGETLEGIISYLEEQYLPLILSGQYSRQNAAFGNWGAFTGQDRQLIHIALGKLPK